MVLLDIRCCDPILSFQRESTLNTFSFMQGIIMALPTKRTIMMLRQLSFIVLFLTTLLLQAQTQQGYVKTLGRPNQKGVALNGVSIRVRGGHYAVLSKDKGFFSMIMSGRKKGVLEDFKRFAEAEIIPKKYEADVEKIKKMLNE